MINRMFIIGLVVLLSFIQSPAQLKNEQFTLASNVGNPAQKGKFIFEPSTQTWLLEGSGYNMWNIRDEFFFLSQVVKGDLIFSASLDFPGKGIEPHRKAGLMFRSSLDDDSPYVDIAVHGDGLTSIQYRSEKGGDTHEVSAQVKAPDFVQIEKSGNNFILRISKQQTPLDEVASVQVILGQEFHAGMFICSHNPEVMEKVRFWNVRLDVPAETIGGEDAPASPSRLEILDVENNKRMIIYSTEKHIEAPNWSRDGKYLIFNESGRLFRFGLKNKKIKQINTGSAVANNNDHGISFDGKILAISNHVEENNNRNSIIFTLPLKGGTPRRITDTGPSYWHGWSPDGNWLAYCAERNGNYDVYKIPSTGGREIRLTTSEGLDDGPEFSPDGKFICFNSVRDGMMQIWRMKPDGSDQEQVTKDEFNNWFAHPSPDGKQLIFISYLADVSAGSHPRNHRVMLRIMPSEGGQVRSLAFLYGGQGTMNVPSWSPDSKKVAFVSYTY